MKKKRALMFASVASMVDLFNRENIAALEELGYEVTIACNFSEGSVYTHKQAKRFMHELKKKGYDVINVPVPRSMYDIKGMIVTYVKLVRDMKNKQYDIVHCQSPIGGVLCRLAASGFRKNGTKVLYYAHGFHFWKGAPIKNWVIFYTIERFFSRFTDCLVTLNKEDYKRASKEFHSRVEFVHGVGLDIDEIDRVYADKEEKCKELGIPSDKKIVLSVCELSERKNCLTAIRAFIQADREDAILLLCGIGAEENMLKKYVKDHNAEDKIYFAGFRNDIIEIFKMSDVFIFTSKQEGLPVALMQAMATGLPALCSKIRGNKDLIKNGQGGYMYDPWDTRGYTEGLSLLLDNEEECIRMGEYNRKHVKKYDIDSVNKKMKKIYISLSGQQ